MHGESDDAEVKRPGSLKKIGTKFQENTLAGIIINKHEVISKLGIQESAGYALDKKLIQTKAYRYTIFITDIFYSSIDFYMNSLYN
jgi:hypothetical protein